MFDFNALNVHIAFWTLTLSSDTCQSRSAPLVDLEDGEAPPSSPQVLRLENKQKSPKTFSDRSKSLWIYSAICQLFFSSGLLAVGYVHSHRGVSEHMAGQRNTCNHPQPLSAEIPLSKIAL